MAINTTSLTQLITEFRNLTVKDAITPESLGYILQRIADLLKSATSEADISNITGWSQAVMSEAGYLLKTLAVDTTDPSAVNLNITAFSLSDCLTDAYPITIPAATQTASGVMSATQATALNKASTDIATLQSDVRYMSDEVVMLSDNFTSMRSSTNSTLEDHSNRISTLEETSLSREDHSNRISTLEETSLSLDHNIASLQETVNSIYDTRPWLDDRQIYKLDGIVDIHDELDGEGATFPPGTYYIRSSNTICDLTTDRAVVVNWMLNNSQHGHAQPRSDIFYVINGRFAAVDNTGQLLVSTATPA